MTRKLEKEIVLFPPRFAGTIEQGLVQVLPFVDPDTLNPDYTDAEWEEERWTDGYVVQKKIVQRKIKKPSS